MLKRKKRYSFWKVFWVVLGLNLIFTILGFIALSVSPMYSKDFNWNKLFTWHYLLSQLISISFSSAFYFFAVNNHLCKVFFKPYRVKSYPCQPVFVSTEITHYAVCCVGNNTACLHRVAKRIDNFYSAC